MTQMMIKSPLSGFVVGAKHYGSAAANYYRTGGGIIPDPDDYNGLIYGTGSGDTYLNMTLVFAVYPLELPDLANWYIFNSASDYFNIGNWDGDGGIWASVKKFSGGLPLYIYTEGDGAGDYGGLTPNAWNAIMITLQTSGANRYGKIWSNGIEVYDGAWGTGNDPINPMSWAGYSYAGYGDGDVGMECYMSYIWCAETYLDPDIYYSDFFDANNKPKDIDVDGSGVTGSQPDTFAPNGDLTNNLGFADNWDEFGTVPDAPISPTD